jgi:hypothetical protein
MTMLAAEIILCPLACLYSDLIFYCPNLHQSVHFYCKRSEITPLSSCFLSLFFLASETAVYFQVCIFVSSQKLIVLSIGIRQSRRAKPFH